MTLPKDHLPDDAEARRRQQADPLVAAVIRTADDAGLTCPDAEVLGLYAERELAGEEQAAVSAHVDHCARCQATLQAIERAMPDAAGTTALPARWFGGWRWLVPVTSLAAAAVVAVWLGQGPARESTVAQAPDAFRTAPQAAEAPAAGAEVAREARDEAASPAAPPVARPAAPRVEAAPEPPRRGRAAVPSGATPDRAEPAATAEREEVAGMRADRLAESADAERRQSVGALANTAPAAAAPPPVAALTETAGAPAAANAQAAAKETADRAVGRSRGLATLEDTRTPPAWRVREGVLERTSDAGRTWQRVSLPTTERVASVVEQPAGTVTVVTVAGSRLVSTDDGATWRRP